MNDPIHILSLGAGVQSSCLALMAAKGEIGPMPLAAIFSDTHAEPKAVYDWLDWLEKQLPFPVYRVSAGSLTDASLKRHVNKTTGKPYYANLIPAYAKNEDGSSGLLGRTCTYRHKLIPFFRKARQLAKIKRGQKTVGVVSWVGISLDEVSRMKPTRDAWVQNRWPLIEKEMTRHDCIRWIKNNGYLNPPRSACTYCPFHSDREWRALKTDSPGEFQSAVDFERALQRTHASVKTEGKRQSAPFLHNSMIPLGEIDFSEDTTQGQLRFHNECEGMCGV